MTGSHPLMAAALARLRFLNTMTAKDRCQSEEPTFDCAGSNARKWPAAVIDSLVANDRCHYLNRSQDEWLRAARSWHREQPLRQGESIFTQQSPGRGWCEAQCGPSLSFVGGTHKKRAAPAGGPFFQRPDLPAGCGSLVQPTAASLGGRWPSLEDALERPNISASRSSRSCETGACLHDGIVLIGQVDSLRTIKAWKTICRVRPAFNCLHVLKKVLKRLCAPRWQQEACMLGHAARLHGRSSR
jgi:hypothetical protein